MVSAATKAEYANKQRFIVEAKESGARSRHWVVSKFTANDWTYSRQGS